MKRSAAAGSDARTVASTCWECSTGCGSLVNVQDSLVTGVAPNPDHPATRGAFCVKGIRGLPELTYGSSRIVHPQRRVGPRGSGRFERISWDSALDEMADHFAAIRSQFGPLALAGAVSGAFYSRGAVIALLLRSLGSPNWMINQDLCGGCRAVSDMVTGLNISGGADIDNAACALVVVAPSCVIINDPETVAALQSVAIGARANAAIGGKLNPYDEGPVEIEVSIIFRSNGRFGLEDRQSHLAAAVGTTIDMGPSLVVRAENVTILLTSRKTPPFDLGQLRSQGIEPREMRVIGVKAAVAHRRAYDPIAAAAYTVSTSGPCPGRLADLPYRRLRRPVFPLDPL